MACPPETCRRRGNEGRGTWRAGSALPAGCSHPGKPGGVGCGGPRRLAHTWRCLPCVRGLVGLIAHIAENAMYAPPAVCRARFPLQPRASDSERRQRATRARLARPHLFPLSAKKISGCNHGNRKLPRNSGTSNHLHRNGKRPTRAQNHRPGSALSWVQECWLLHFHRRLEAHRWRVYCRVYLIDRAVRQDWDTKGGGARGFDHPLAFVYTLHRHILG